MTFFFVDASSLPFSWYWYALSPLSPIFSLAATQPQTKEELKAWIKEYNGGGVKNHGEPKTWDVTLVTDMSNLFKDMKKFNAPIDQWNTSEVTNMDSMFQFAILFNQPITMDTSKVTKMDSMFEGADAMTHPLPQTKEMIAVSNFF